LILWDRFVRILHWSLAAVVTANLFFLDGHDEPHKWAGYFALVVVLVRLGWGSLPRAGHSRLKEFPLSFADFRRFLSDLPRRQSIPFEGHNPVASLNYILIWLMVLALAQTGWMLSWDRYFGEEWVEVWHSRISTALEVLVVMHLVGVFFDSWRYRRATFLSMIRGRREFTYKPKS
jgi:cytochrome b